MLYVDSENIREDLERKEKAIDLSNYYYQPNFLSQKEIDFLIEIAEDKTQRATTFSGESNEKRRSNVGWISPKEDGRDNSWVFQKISALASAANKHMYNFDICGM